MKHSIIIFFIGATASLIALPQVAASFFAREQPQDASELRERDEINQTFKLTPGARVDVSRIRGPVEIETADIDVAEVHIVSSAQNRSDLDLYKVSVEHNPQSLTIRGEQTRRDSGYGPDVRHHVQLKLPRRIALSIEGIGSNVKVSDIVGPLVVNTVSGTLNVGAVDGQIQVTGVGGEVSIGHATRQAVIKTVTGKVKIGQASDSLNITGVQGVSIGQVAKQVTIETVTGDVEIGQASDSLNVTSVSGTVSVGISKLGQSGVQIHTVTGQVELRFRDALNAQLSTNNIIGELAIDLPDVTVQSRPNVTSVRALIGKGGPLISIDAVSKSVHLVKGY